MTSISFEIPEVPEAPRSYLAQAEGVMPGDLVQSILYGSGPFGRRTTARQEQVQSVPVRTAGVVPTQRGHRRVLAREFDADRESERTNSVMTQIRNSLRPRVHKHDVDIPDFDPKLMNQYIFPGAQEVIPHETQCVCQVPRTMGLAMNTHTTRIHQKLLRKPNILKLALLGTEQHLWPPPPMEDLPILAGRPDNRICACSFIGPTAMTAFLRYAVPHNIRHRTTAAGLPKHDPHAMIRHFVSMYSADRHNRARIDSLATRVHAMTLGRMPHTSLYEPIDTRSASRARRSKGMARLTHVADASSIPASIREEARYLQNKFSSIL